MTINKAPKEYKNELVKRFAKESIWVNFRFKTLEDGRQTKIPYDPNTNRKASSTDPLTWSDYETAKLVSERIGIIFTGEKKLLGIDIDHCVNAETGEIEHEKKDEIERFIREADSYCEVSPSGTGVHIFIECTEPYELIKNREKPYEIYNAGRYFTVTEKPFVLEMPDPKRMRANMKVVYNKPIKKLTPHEVTILLSLIGYPWSEIEDVAPMLLQTIQPHTLTDSELLAKIFSSKNGKKIQALYESTGETGKSEDDLSLLNHLAFWTQKDFAQMERLWLTSSIGQRKKTQERQDYRVRSIDQAIKNCKETYNPSPIQTQIVEKVLEKESPELELLFTETKNGGKVFVLNTENICRILKHHSAFKGRLRYDKFKNTLEYDPYGIGRWRGFEDSDDINIQTTISVLFPPFMKVGKLMIQDAMLKVAKENAIDSAVDLIESITWDKTGRLDHWLSNTYGCPDDEYHQSVGSNWLKGMIKRIVHPGCKFDYVLVLEGEQGTKKSTSLSVLGEMENGHNWHVETSMGTDNKDFFMQFSGKAIVEFSEGETLSRTEVKKMKSIITTQSDKYRPPYSRVSIDFPRRCVFAMTTNETEYLKDDTGNRRWLPVKLEFKEANIDWLRENRDQLLAEAHYRISVLKETIYEFHSTITVEQNLRRIRDVNADTVVDWYEKLDEYEKNQGVVIKEIYERVIGGGIYAKPFDRYEEMKLAGVLKADLNLEKRRVRQEGTQSNRWYRRDVPIQEMIEIINERNLEDEEVYKQFE